MIFHIINVISLHDRKIAPIYQVQILLLSIIGPEVLPKDILTFFSVVSLIKISLLYVPFSQQLFKVLATLMYHWNLHEVCKLRSLLFFSICMYILIYQQFNLEKSFSKLKKTKLAYFTENTYQFKILKVTEAQDYLQAPFKTRLIPLSPFVFFKMVH